MKQNLFFVLIAIAILYLIYSFSKNTPKQLHKKKLVKETFNQLGNVATEIDDYSVTFLDQELDQEMDPEYWRRLNSNLVFSNSNLLTEIENLEERLEEVRLDIIRFTSSNDYLTGEIDKLTDLNATLVQFIREKSGCETNNPKYGISNCDDSHIFDVDTMQTYKNTLQTTFKNLVDKLNTMLVQDHYNELDAGTLELNYENVQVQHIQRIINNLESIKTAYHHFYQQLQVSPETPDTDTWDTTASTIMTEAQSNCENRFIEDECIYATKSNGITIGYYTSNMNYAFHSNLWPSEDSCEQDPEDNCHSIGELSSSNCDGNKKTCYDLISDDPVNSSHLNNKDRLGHISYNSNSYTYTSEQLSNVVGEWSCELNYPSQANRGDTCKTESDITDEARDNCEGGQSLWGVASYDCYTNTGTNEVNGYATYSGTDELPSVSSQKGSGRSKVWSNSNNGDGTFGTCTVDDTCRTLAETSNMAACLTQANSNDYTMNYQCYGTSGTNTGISSESNGNYRKQYQVGSFDNNTNQWSSDGPCYEAHSNYRDCRTKADVDAEVAWKTTANWQCYTYSNGDVNALEQWNKNYEVNNGFSTNSNIGTKSYTDECRKQEDASAYEDCVTDNQYFCWKDQGSDLESNIKKQFSKQNTKNKNYTEVATTSNDRYADMSRADFDDNCTTSDCTSSNQALSTITIFCESSSERSTCYKDGTASSNPFGDEVSWSIVYDSNSNFGQYSTRVIQNDDHIQCEERNTCDTQSNVCDSKSNKCYTQPTFSSDSNTNFFDMTSNNYKSSILDSSGSNCVPDCVTLPYCSYMAVETNDSNEFVWGDIGKNDCSDPSEGKRYRWTLETNSVASVSNPASYSNTVGDSNSNHWRAVNSPDTSSNSNCTPINTMVGNAVTTITTEGDESKILCQCDPIKSDHYALRYYAGAFDSNSPSNIGYSNLEDLQSSNCESNECKARNYYTAKERLVDCTHSNPEAINNQGEHGLGDKYLDITLSNNGLLCYNDNACSNLCLVSGPSTISTQIGDGVYDTEDPSTPAKCFTYGTSNQQNQFSYASYAANGSLLTNMPTCTNLVDEQCSSNQNPNCGPIDNVDWSSSVRSYIPGTTNKSATTYRDTTGYDGTYKAYNGTGVTNIAGRQVTYNSSCSSNLLANQTAQLKKGLFKYVYTHRNDGDGICIPETTTHVKYIVENIDPSDNDYGTHSYCPMNCVVTQTWGSWNNNGGGSTVPSIPVCEASNNYTRTQRLQSSRYGGSNCEATTGSSFNVNDNETGGAIIETQTYNNNNVDSLKPCCASNGNGHFTSSPSYSYTVSAVNSGATRGSNTYTNEHMFNNPSTIPCNTKITKTTRTRYTPNSAVCSGGQPEYYTDTSSSRSNSTACDVDCVGSWSNWTTCADTCGTTPTQTRTFSIRTGKQGNGQYCFNLAQSLIPDDHGLMDSLPDKNINSDSFTITKDCPTNLDCILPQIPTISVSDITRNSAIIRWTNNNGSIDQGHITNRLKYKKTTDSDWVDVINSGSTNTYTLIGLDSSTSYQVQIIKNVTIGPYSGRTFSDGTLLSAYDSRKESFYTPMDLSGRWFLINKNYIPRYPLNANVIHPFETKVSFWKDSWHSEEFIKAREEESISIYNRCINDTNLIRCLNVSSGKFTQEYLQNALRNYINDGELTSLHFEGSTDGSKTFRMYIKFYHLPNEKYFVQLKKRKINKLYNKDNIRFLKSSDDGFDEERQKLYLGKIDVDDETQQFIRDSKMYYSSDQHRFQHNYPDNKMYFIYFKTSIEVSMNVRRYDGIVEVLKEHHTAFLYCNMSHSSDVLRSIEVVTYYRHFTKNEEMPDLQDQYPWLDPDLCQRLKDYRDTLTEKDKYKPLEANVLLSVVSAYFINEAGENLYDKIPAIDVKSHGYENINELNCDPTYVHGYRRLPSYSKNNGKETKDRLIYYKQCNDNYDEGDVCIQP